MRPDEETTYRDGVKDSLKNMSDWQIQHAQDDRAQFKEIGDTLGTIKDNHLYHMEKDMAKLANDAARIKWLLMGIASLVGTVLAGVAINYFSKLIT